MKSYGFVKYMTEDIIILIAVGGVLLITAIWHFTDPRPVSDRVRFFVSSRKTTYILFFFLLLVLYLALALYGKLPFTLPFIVWGGIFLYGLGFALAVWAKITMKMWWGPAGYHDPKRQYTLVTHGPFAYTRNPIYIGVLAMFAGFSIAMQSTAFILLPVFYIIMHRTVLTEEQALMRQFGQKYKNYSLRVRRYL